jgi:RimJ/RimL family protein N-acetyltransferase/quercetin dioxygenase-like cupin family protein
MSGNTIRTPRLELISATIAQLRSELDGRDALARELGARVPENWPPELYGEHLAAVVTWGISRLEAAPEAAHFFQYYFVLAESERTVIGVGGFKGPPHEGAVELGYGVLEQYRRSGYATEATLGMLAFAFSHAEIDVVVAQTLPHLTPSIGVLDKTGFRVVGAGAEEGEENVIRFEITRAEWQRRQPSAGSFAEKLARVDAHWTPKRVARVNETDVKVVRIQGEFVWHRHEREDEMFVVLKGRLLMQFRDREQWIGPGEFIVVPHGVEHRPVAPEEVQMLLIEPSGTLNTGNVVNERTVADVEAI